jgi:anti-sigma regulatory factor (Ser/Thr protein kinase)
MGGSWERCERFPAAPTALQRIRARVARAARDAGFDEREAGRIATAANEAAANVIRHGYGGAPGHAMDLHLALTPTEFVIEILDEGRQTDPAALRPPADGDPRSPGGLGLAWMFEIMDTVDFQRRPTGGMRTHMARRRPESKT